MNDAAAPQALADLLQRAMLLHQGGDLDAALRAYREVLRLDGQHVVALRLAGMIECQQGRNAEGMQLLEAALAQTADDAEAQHNFALVLWGLRERERAMQHFDCALSLAPGFAQARMSRGDALSEQGRHAEALADYEAAISVAGAQPALRWRFVRSLKHLRRLDEALAQCVALCAAHPEMLEAQVLHADILLDLREPAQALAMYDNVLAQQARADASYGRGNALSDLDRFDEAVAGFQTALALQPAHPLAWNNLGVAQRALMQLDAAEASYLEALRLDAEAPASQFNLGMLYLLRGDAARGWPLYEQRWCSVLDARDWPRDTPLWRGQFPLQGRRILLHAEQGLGDTLQFCRYVPAVAALGAEVLLRVPKSLCTLLAQLPAQVSSFDEAEPPHDCHCPLMSLPFALREFRPSSAPYLLADAQRVAQWAQRIGPRDARLRVGLVWAGGERADQPDAAQVSRRRNIPLPLLRVLAMPEVALFSLQKGAAAEAELQAGCARGEWADMVDLAPFLADFAETAAALSQLDVLIAVDTAVMHLAGALGLECWLLNRFDTCWRWGVAREDSEWYARLRQFRQRAPGDWAEVLGRVRAALLAYRA